MSTRYMAAAVCACLIATGACKKGSDDTPQQSAPDSTVLKRTLPRPGESDATQMSKRMGLKLTGLRTCESVCLAMSACLPAKLKQKPGFEKSLLEKCKLNCELRVKRGSSLERFAQRAGMMCQLFKRRRGRGPDGPPRRVVIDRLVPYRKPTPKEGSPPVLTKPIEKVTLPRADKFECPGYCKMMWLCVPSQVRMTTTEEKYDQICSTGCAALRKDPERVKKALTVLELLCKSAGRL